MSLLWIEGFEGFGLTAGNAPVGLTAKYPSNSGTTTLDVEAGRYAGFCMEWNDAFALFRIPAQVNTDPVVTGFAWKVRTGQVVGDSALVALYEGTNTPHLTLQTRQTGQELRIYRGNTSGTALETTSGLSLDVNTWYYIEIKATISDSPGGSYEVKVNGTTVLSGSGIDTRNGGTGVCNSVMFGQCRDGYMIDDFYFLNTAGSINNDFLGNRAVEAIYPSSAGDDNDWVNSAATAGTNNFGFVDENPTDDDTTYVESATLTDLDLYNYQSVPTLPSINGVQINTNARITDVVEFNLRQVVKSDGTTSEGSDTLMTSTTYSTPTRVLETDPDTSAAWTVSGVNAAQFGVKVG